jgi:NAD(P)H-nitrite reductase large subunit
VSKFDYLIIGNSAAAVGAVEGIRGTGNNGSIGIVSHETHHVYSRPMISDAIVKKSRPEDMAYRPLDFYEKHNVTLLAGRLATAIDTKAQSVTLEDGQVIEYGKLLLSTGARPAKPPIPGIDAAGVHFFTTYDEANGVAYDLDGVQEVVIIGAGLIGMQAAEALSKVGIKVTVVEMCDRPLALNLDPHASSIVRNKFEEHGVSFRTSCKVNEILKDASGRVRGVAIGTGEELPCTLAIVATGVSPRVELAKDAGLKLNRGICVDEFMQTSDPNIYAAGDVAEAYDILMAEHRLVPIWPNAYVEGRTAGLAMAGKPVPFRGEIAMNSAHFFGYPIISAGITDPRDAETDLMEEDAGTECYRRIIMKGAVPVGMVMAGDSVDRSGLVLGLIKNQTDSTAFMDKLASPTFCNAHLPDYLRKSKQQGKEQI